MTKKQCKSNKDLVCMEPTEKKKRKLFERSTKSLEDIKRIGLTNA